MKYLAVVLCLIYTCYLGASIASRCKCRTLTAGCNLDPVDQKSKLRGRVTFTQRVCGSRRCKNGPLNVNLRADGVTGGPEHGMHIHTGAATSGCTDAGPHYNPFNVVHGAREDTQLRTTSKKGKVRHVGDLGNSASFKIKGQKSIRAVFYDKFLSLDVKDGDFFFVGRTFAVHSGRDDLGRGGDAGSAGNGNSGPGLACCVVRFFKQTRKY